MLYFTTFARSPRCTNFYKNRFGGISPGRNHMFTILSQPVTGFRFCEGSNFAISHRKAWSPLTRCLHYRAARDNSLYYRTSRDFRFRICWFHCLQNVKVCQQTKFRRDIPIFDWDTTISRFEIQTSAILEFYFRFRSPPVRRNLHVILHQAAELRPNRNTHCGNITSYPFLKMAAATANYYFRLRVFLMSLPPKGQSLSANQISSTYLNWRLRYKYFRFWKTNVRRIGNLLSVSILVICTKSAHYSVSGYRISSKSKHPQRKYDVLLLPI